VSLEQQKMDFIVHMGLLVGEIIYRTQQGEIVNGTFMHIPSVTARVNCIIGLHYAALEKPQNVEPSAN
jgi:hypothetical protein